MMQKYDYTTLDLAKNETRILTFRNNGSQEQEMVRCSLRHVSLDDPSPEYEAFVAERMKPSSPEQLPEGVIRNRRSSTPAETWVQSEVESERYFQRDVARFRINGWRYSNTTGRGLMPGSVLNVPARYTWGDFEAVSYCWESNTRDRDIHVDGFVVKVTHNLEALLRQLQNLPEARSGMGFWIDGVCINQDDVSEKNHQVGLMKRIYSQALSTIVWLGPEDATSDRAMEALERGPNSGADWQAVLTLWARNYFTRIWIIQELALNRNLSMFLCGTKAISRERFTKVCHSVPNRTGHIATTIQDHLGNSYRDPIDQDYIWTLATKVGHLLEVPASGALYVTLLDLAHKSKATDPRDKVYGLLGLLPEDMVSQIRLDYAKSKEEVFVEFARQMLDRCTHLDEVLSWCTFVQDPSSLPSWVPDWIAKFERNHMQWFRSHRAGGETPSSWTLAEAESTLRCKGIRIDIVSGTTIPVSSSLPYRVAATECMSRANNFPAGFGRYKNWLELCATVDRTLIHDHQLMRKRNGKLTELHWIDWRRTLRYTDGKHILESNPHAAGHWRKFERFRQTNALFSIFGYSLRDFFASPNEPLVESISQLFPQDDHSVKETITPQGNNQIRYSGDMPDLISVAAIGLHARTMITTTTGFLGLAPEEVKIGDVVAILFGCAYPVILRPYVKGFKYVGECYVDGLMDGEAVQAANRGEYEVEDVLIL